MPSDHDSPSRTAHRQAVLAVCAAAVIAALDFLSTPAGAQSPGTQAAEAQAGEAPTNQPQAAAPPPRQEGTTQPGIELAPPAAEPRLPAPAGPDTTIWIDDNGVPRPVVGVTYDDFAKAWRAYQGSGPALVSPRFTLNRVGVDGRQVNGHAELDVSLELELLTDERVEAPIGFGSAVLDKLPDGLLPNDTFGYSEQAEAYALVMSGKGSRTLRLSLLAPIRTSGQTNELSLSLPRATLSQMRLQLSGRATDVVPLEGALLDVDQQDEGARLTVTGGVGQVRLRWRSPDQSQAAAQTVLDAEGEITSIIDGGGVKSTAVLRVRSFGGEFERFQVRLPRGAKRIPTETAVDSAVRIEPSADGRTCAVLLPEKTTGPVTVEIATELAIGSAAGGEETNQLRVDLAGFEVLGAVRQEGYHAIVVDEDTQLKWFDLRGARRVAVDELPASLASTQAKYAVRCFRPESSIPVEVRQRETRIQASPSYHLEILPDVALLHVSTRYQIIGAPVLDFSFALNDWKELTSDPIEPAELVDSTSLYQDDYGTLDIPMTRPQAGNLTVGFHARKYDLTPDGSTFEIELPQPSRPAPYTLDGRQLRITVDPSLRMVIDPRTFEALEPAPAASDANDPAGQQTFRFRDDAYALLPDKPIRLVGSLTRRAGELYANAATTSANVYPQMVSVVQKFDLEVRKQPRERIEFEAPAGLAEAAGIMFSLVTDAPSKNDARETTEGQALEHSLNMGTGRFVVELPRPWVGALNIDAVFTLPSGSDSLNQDGALTIPLLTPRGVASLTHDATIHSSEDLTLLTEGSSDGWRAEDSPPGDLRLVGPSNAGALRLARVPQRKLVESPTMVTRVWRQSWRRGATLQQRSAWRVLTNQPEVLLGVPPDGAPLSVVIHVDGEPVRPEPLDARTLRVELPAGVDGEAAEHTIEARHVGTLASESGGSVVLHPLQIQADASQATCYWQVILPSDRWLLSAPKSLRPAWRVGWRQGRLSRLPVKGAEALEEWVGATHQDLPIAAGERAYLYSALTLPEGPWKVVTIDQKLATLGASLVALVVGLIVSYSPTGVRNVTIAVLCVLILLAGYWRPADLALAAQAGAIGLVALFAGWVAMLTLAPRQKPLVDISDDSTSIRRSSTNRDGHVSVAGGTVSTNAPTVSLETSNPLP